MSNLMFHVNACSVVGMKHWNTGDISAILSTLPNDTLDAVMEYLSIRELSKLGSTCRVLMHASSRAFCKRDATMEPSMTSDAPTCRERLVRAYLASEMANTIELLADSHYIHGSSELVCHACDIFPNLNVEAFAPARRNEYEYYLRISDPSCDGTPLWEGFVPCRSTSGMTDYAEEPGYADIQEVNAFLKNSHLSELNLDLRHTSIFQNVHWESRPNWRARDTAQDFRVTVIALRRSCEKHLRSLLVTTGGFQHSQGTPPGPTCWIAMDRHVYSHQHYCQTESQPYVAPVFFVNWKDHCVETLTLVYSGGAGALGCVELDHVGPSVNRKDPVLHRRWPLKDVDWKEMDYSWANEELDDYFDEEDLDDADLLFDNYSAVDMDFE